MEKDYKENPNEVIKNVENLFMKIRRYLKNIVGKTIEYIEKYEYRNLDLDTNDINKKIIDTQEVHNLTIKTDMGYSPVSYIHKTQPYQVYELETENGKNIECADNHIVYKDDLNEVYVYDLGIGDNIMTSDGYSPIKNIYKAPYKLSMYDISVEDFNHRYFANDILSHNTTTTVAFIAWYLCFHTDRNIAVLANKQDTAIEIINKLTEVFRGLPFFLKPGIKSIGKKGMSLDNGCMIMAQATTKTATIGFTIHVLYMDECAHVQPNIMDSLWRSIYPTLSSSKISQCIVSSTPNGAGNNRFFKIWDGANKGTNSFVPIRVDWWQIPGKDEEWAKSERANIGDEEFEQEYGLSFNVSSKVFFRSSDLMLFSKIAKPYSYVEMDNFKIETEKYDTLTWHNNFNPNNVRYNDTRRRFLISVDTGEGKENYEDKENDYNVFHVFELKLKSISQMRTLLPSERKIQNMFRLVQVGMYRDNFKDEANSAIVCRDLVYESFGDEICKINLEMNFNGKNWVTHFSSNENFNDFIFVKTFHNKPIPGEKLPPKKIGYKTNSNKEWFCKCGRKSLQDRCLIPTNTLTVNEMSAFGRDNSGKLKGIGVKDDMTIALLMTSHFTTQEDYIQWCEDLFESLDDSYEKIFASMLLNRYNEDDFDDISLSNDLIYSPFDSEMQQNYGIDMSLYSNLTRFRQ